MDASYSAQGRNENELKRHSRRSFESRERSKGRAVGGVIWYGAGMEVRRHVVIYGLAFMCSKVWNEQN
jgi:hypothetical protein